jgi:hypothetical protein
MAGLFENDAVPEAGQGMSILDDLSIKAKDVRQFCIQTFCKFLESLLRVPLHITDLDHVCLTAGKGMGGPATWYVHYPWCHKQHHLMQANPCFCDSL